MAFNNEKIAEILELLEGAYPDADCALNFRSTYELIIAVVLSAQTTDVSVNKVTPALFEKYPNAKALASADEEDVQEIIRKIGMYKTKSKNIIRLAQKLESDFDGQVPEDYDALVSLPGVGRKTANVVRAVGFGKQAIAVDTHVFRVSNRIGLVKEKDVLKTELSLMKVIPEDRWSRTHHLLIFHGRKCCKAKNPDCAGCCLNNICKSSTVS